MSKDKRITIRQAIHHIHEAYDNIDALAAATAEEVLKELFGFGPTRLARFRERYNYVFAEKAAEKADEIIRNMRRVHSK